MRGAATLLMVFHQRHTTSRHGEVLVPQTQDLLSSKHAQADVAGELDSRLEAGRVLHTSCASTSEPKGWWTPLKHAMMVASSAGVVLRQPAFLPRA